MLSKTFESNVNEQFSGHGKSFGMERERGEVLGGGVLVMGIEQKYHVQKLRQS